MAQTIPTESPCIAAMVTSSSLAPMGSAGTGLMDADTCILCLSKLDFTSADAVYCTNCKEPMRTNDYRSEKLPEEPQSRRSSVFKKRLRFVDECIDLDANNTKKSEECHVRKLRRSVGFHMPADSADSSQ